jgi:hypothetical protein
MESWTRTHRANFRTSAPPQSIPRTQQLSEKEVHELALEVLGAGNGRYVSYPTAISKDNPLVTVVGGRLIASGVKNKKPMRDNNVLVRFIKPAARALGIGFVNWRCLRTSHATWLKLAGADVKDAQAQMRHSRASTTLDIYQQLVPESQRAAVDRLTNLPRTYGDRLMLINRFFNWKQMEAEWRSVVCELLN